jgi:hypothetical protein
MGRVGPGLDPCALQVTVGSGRTNSGKLCFARPGQRR